MTEASNLRFIIRRRDEQITALREALVKIAKQPKVNELEQGEDEGDFPEAYDCLIGIARQAFAAAEPEAEEAECWEGCEDPQCPYTHPRHQGESR